MNGRTWDRNGREVDPLEATEGDFSALLQGFRGWLEGDSEQLSATGFHSAGGRIWDTVAGSDELRRLVARLVRELVGE